MNSNEEDEYYFFNNIIFDESGGVTKRDGYKQSNKETKHCTHNWKKYVGFTDVYYYCDHCDEKTNNDYESSKKWYLKD